MPYKVVKAPGKGFEVINQVTGAVKAKHSTHENALKQMKLLYGIEHGMVPGKRPGSYHGRQHDKMHMEGSQVPGKY